MAKQTRVEQEVRALCEQRGIEIYDTDESYIILIDHEDCQEYAITYHDGYERLRQREITGQWRGALEMLQAIAWDEQG